MERPEISYHKAKFNSDIFYTDDEIERIKKCWIAYIDSKYTVGYTETNTCALHGNGICRSFGVTLNLARMFNEKTDRIKNCKVTIIEDHVSILSMIKTPGYNAGGTDYFGWVAYDDDDAFEHGINLIQPNIHMFSMQFVGGGDIEASHLKGKIVRLKIEVI